LVHRHLEHRVNAQIVGVIAVFIASGDHQHAEPDDVGQAVGDQVWIARVVDTRRQSIGNTKPPLNLAQHQQAAVRRQLPAIKSRNNRLVRNG
jgi:hypothetical protein